MKKESIERLLELGKFCLNDEQYRKLEYYTKNKMWLNLRVFLGDIFEDFEVKEAVQGGMAKEWVSLDEMVDIAINLAIQNEERLNEERRIIVRTRYKQLSN